MSVKFTLLIRKNRSQRYNEIPLLIKTDKEIDIFYISLLFIAEYFSPMSYRSCTNDPNLLCYICWKYILLLHRLEITKSVQNGYVPYFCIVIGDQDERQFSHTACFSCVSLNSGPYGQKKGAIWHPYGMKSPYK